jgi:hypothetical protein
VAEIFRCKIYWYTKKRAFSLNCVVKCLQKATPGHSTEFSDFIHLNAILTKYPITTNFQGALLPSSVLSLFKQVILWPFRFVRLVAYIPNMTQIFHSWRHPTSACQLISLTLKQNNGNSLTLTPSYDSRWKQTTLRNINTKYNKKRENK